MDETVHGEGDPGRGRDGGRRLGRPVLVTGVALGLAAMAVAVLAPLGGLVMAQGSPEPASPLAVSSSDAPVATPAPKLTPAPQLTATPQVTPAQSPAPASSAAAWQYRTVFAEWDTRTADWVARFADGTTTSGLAAILDEEGAHGWELVSVVPELTVDVIAGNQVNHEVRRLRAYFKKPGP